MNETIPYGKIFSQLEAKRLIIFEDDFNGLKEKNALLYGFARMDELDQNELLHYVEQIDSSASDQLASFAAKFNLLVEPKITSWQDQIIENDIVTSFSLVNNGDRLTISELYDAVNINNWSGKDKIFDAFYRYAIGIEVSEAYSTLFDEYVGENGRRGPIMVFRDFSADSSRIFLDEIEKRNNDESTTVCIIDDMLQETPRADEIVESIRRKFNSERTNIIGIIFSSKESQDNISDDIYLERVKKGNSEDSLKAALAKSAYSFLLSRLSSTYKNALNDAFSDAIKSKNIAFYLSNMATAEGCTNYQVISDWINQIYRFKVSKSPKLVSIAKLSRLISLLEDETVKFDSETLEMNSFEAFDYNVNFYREPIAPGDIFMTDNKKLYIMVGQACDTMFRNAKDGCNNGVIELVSAELKSQDTTDLSVRMKSDYIWISNFMCTEGTNKKYKALKVRYVSKGLVDNQILQLSQFNDDGECIINFEKEKYKEKGVEPEYYGELYSKLFLYFKSLQRLKKKDIDLFSTVIENDLSKRLISAGNWKENNQVLSYGIRRIGRLRHPYILYLNKMYLEYQGRHPFDCINLTRIHRMEVPVDGTSETLPINVVLSTERDTNMKRIDLLPWVIDIRELVDIFRREGETINYYDNSNIIIYNDKIELSIGSQEKADTKMVLSKDISKNGSVKLVVSFEKKE